MIKKGTVLLLILCSVASSAFTSEYESYPLTPYILLYYWDIYHELHATPGIFTVSLVQELHLEPDERTFVKLRTFLEESDTPIEFAALIENLVSELPCVL